MSIYKIYTVKKRKLTKYEKKKSLAQQLAIDWQQQNINKAHSWKWTCQWFLRWERIGRKYGLIREFKENGIL